MSMIDLNQPEYLLKLAKTGTGDARRSLAEAVTSMLHEGLRGRERILAVEILTYLANEADYDLRVLLAERLSREADCPLEVLRQLIYKNPANVSAPILRYSPVLTNDVLLEIINTCQSPHWQEMAQRPNLSDVISRHLIRTRDIPTSRLLCANDTANICSVGMAWLVSLAQNTPELHQPLIYNTCITAENATKLYWYASQPLRHEIAKRFPLSQALLDTALNVITSEELKFSDNPEKIEPKMLVFAAKLRYNRKINSQLLEETMRRGNLSLFACLWAEWLELDAYRLLSYLQKDAKSILACLYKTQRLPRFEFVTAYLAWYNYHHIQNVTQVDILADAIQLFEKLNTNNARAFLDKLCGLSENKIAIA